MTKRQVEMQGDGTPSKPGAATVSRGAAVSAGTRVERARPRAWRGALAGASMLAAMLAGPALGAERLLVFAAASLQGTVDAVARRFEEQGGAAAAVSFAASSTLALQIERGAAADLLVSASPEWTDRLEAARLLRPGTRGNLLGNRLVLVAPAPRGAPMSIRRHFRHSPVISASPIVPHSPVISGSPVTPASPIVPASPVTPASTVVPHSLVISGSPVTPASPVTPGSPVVRHSPVTRHSPVVPASPVIPAKAGIQTLAQLLGDGRLAMGDPNHVPAGRYAKAALERMGIWRTVADRVAGAADVRRALALVARGEAPYGIVYATDALAEDRVAVVGVFPEDSHPPIHYTVAVPAASTHPQAGAFLSFLWTPAARAVFEARGFVAREP